jgi:hypothetical protein
MVALDLDPFMVHRKRQAGQMFEVIAKGMKGCGTRHTFESLYTIAATGVDGWHSCSNSNSGSSWVAPLRPCRQTISAEEKSGSLTWS